MIEVRTKDTRIYRGVIGGLFEDDDYDVIAQVFLACNVLGIGGTLRWNIWGDVEHYLKLAKSCVDRVFSFLLSG